MPRYSEKVLDHFRNPRNMGILAQPDGVGVASNPQCGDTMRLCLRVKEGVIVEARWQTRGCSAAIAASSIASEMLKGRPVVEARKVTRQDIANALGGLPAAKMHGSILAADTLRAALDDYAARRRP